MNMSKKKRNTIPIIQTRLDQSLVKQRKLFSLSDESHYFSLFEFFIFGACFDDQEVNDSIAQQCLN
jgi:hypothetical protein